MLVKAQFIKSISLSQVTDICTYTHHFKLLYIVSPINKMLFQGVRGHEVERRDASFHETSGQGVDFSKCITFITFVQDTSMSVNTLLR
jgi:hypothetical protein